MPLALAIPAIIGIGGSIAGGIIGSKAAGSAANIQTAAADKAGELVQGTANTAADAVQGATDQAITDATSGANSGIKAVGDATSGANAAIQSALDQQRQNQNPYLQAGKMSLEDLQKYLTGEGAKNFNFSPDQFKDTPGFQFELEQGERALQRSQAARGGAVSGSAQKALMGFSQGLAQTRYGQASDRAKDIFQMNRNNTVDPLMKLINVGQDATKSMNQNEGAAGENTSNNLMKSGLFEGDTLSNLGQYTGTTRQRGAGMSGDFRTRGAEGAAGYMIEGANARAAGKIAKGNAWAGAIGGAANAAGGFFSMKNMNAGNKSGKSYLFNKHATNGNWGDE